MSYLGEERSFEKSARPAQPGAHNLTRPIAVVTHSGCGSVQLARRYAALLGAVSHISHISSLRTLRTVYRSLTKLPLEPIGSFERDFTMPFHVPSALLLFGAAIWVKPLAQMTLSVNTQIS